MSKSGFLALLAAGIFATCGAQAQQQPWIVKGGLGYMMPKSNAGNVDFDEGKVGVEFDDAWGGIFSVGYMFDEHWAGEMYVATPMQSDITFRGVGEGEADVVPLTFSALYYFNPNGRWRPYLGAGINFTEFYGEKPNQLHLGGSIGPAATAGIDFLFTRHWFATLDLRWIYVETEVQANGSQHDFGHLQLSPLVAGAMVGYRFGGRRPPAVEAPPPPVAAPVAAAAPAPCAGKVLGRGCRRRLRCRRSLPEHAGRRHGGQVRLQPGLAAGGLLRFRPFGTAARVHHRTRARRAVHERHSDVDREDRGSHRFHRHRAIQPGLVRTAREGSLRLPGLARGVSPSRMQAIGMGESDPVADNATAEGRQLNRRVMLIRTDGGR